MSAISIQKITMWTKLTRHRNVREQINTIKNLGTKLKYDIENKYAVYPFIYEKLLGTPGVS